jgi:hypothetical protein
MVNLLPASSSLLTASPNSLLITLQVNGEWSMVNLPCLFPPLSLILPLITHYSSLIHPPCFLLPAPCFLLLITHHSLFIIHSSFLLPASCSFTIPPFISAINLPSLPYLKITTFGTGQVVHLILTRSLNRTEQIIFIPRQSNMIRKRLTYCT